MAPSKETSCEGHLPVEPASPMKAIQDLTISSPDNRDDREGAPAEIPDNPDNELLPADTTMSIRVAVSTAMQQLMTARLEYLISPSPLLSASQLQHNTTNPISKLPQPFLTLVPQTANENLLLNALHEREAC